MHHPTPRPATASDLPELVRVTNAAYRVEDFFIIGNRTSHADMSERLMKPGATVLVIDGEGDGKLAAAVYVEVREQRGYFGLLAVDPQLQGRGLARALIEGIEDHCRRSGCTDLDLDVVNLRIELPPFYEKFGFVPIGIEQFDETEKLRQPAHMIVMTKKL